MTNLDVYQMYLAIKQHFSDGSYDYHKYNGKIRVNAEKFNSRKDRFHFEKIKRKMQDNPEQVLRYLVANLHDDPKLWIGQLGTSEAEAKYKAWQKYQESIGYEFQQACSEISEAMIEREIDFNELLTIPKDHSLAAGPHLLQLYNNQTIRAEDLITFDLVLDGLFSRWNKTIKDTFFWPISYEYLQRYAPFLEIDGKRARATMRKEFL